ncbi:sensor histidine kinase [Variovorax sp. RT4R15]|uniref:sensor histidine kinase n=1 Tax=Variovorax sp. RT4R15 TaxID=3443737 RepID=UPI003F45D063
MKHVVRDPHVALNPPATPARPPLAMFAGWAVLVALAMSAQLLFQPFVWRNWPWDEVMTAWIELAGNRLAVAVAIALTAALACRLPYRSPLARAAVLAVAIVVGAVAGEFALIAAGSLEAPPDAVALLTRVIQWGMLSASIAGLFFLWRRASALQAEAQALELRQVQNERQIAQARLQALRSQIEPHFLFNTLATVRRLHHTEQGQGAHLLAHFLDYLRCTLPEIQREGSTLRQEIDLVRAYLAVVSVRMDDRLDVAFDVPSSLLDCEFPPLAVATLVENAVKHGVGPAPQGGSILVQARSVGFSLEVVVADTGIGFSSAGMGGSGIGLANIRARLLTLYGRDGTLLLAANHPCGVRASIRMPLVRSGHLQ